MASEPPALTAEDEALLDRLAARVLELRMEVPAILALETSRPLTVIASQALIFLEPMIQALFRLTDYRRFSTLIERREVIESLIRRIEAGVERARVARDERRGAAGGRRG